MGMLHSWARAAVGCMLMAAGASGAPVAAGPQSVLLLVADDLGMQVGCYGDAVVRTPHIDGLAARGVRFTHAFTAVSSCSPSRATLYTGLYPHQSGQYGLAHPPNNVHALHSVKSLPRLLRDAGCRTGIVGKVHVLPDEAYPFDARLPGGTDGPRDVAAVAEQARRFIAGCGNAPFLLVIGFSDPHRAAKGFGNDKSYPKVEPARCDPKDVRVPPWLPDAPDTREDLADYYQSIGRLDRGVGLVLEALEASGRAERTLVIFLSDNGPPFPGSKTTLYEPGIRLPLIVGAPSLKRRGIANAAMVSWVDIAPTILDWEGVKPPGGLPGRSFLPILEEETPAGWDAVFASHVFHEITMYYPMRAIRTRGHKYILNLAHGLEFPFASDLFGSRTWQAVLRDKPPALGARPIEAFLRRPREELYDLEKDPLEAVNVVADPAYADVLSDLRARLRRWQEETRDPWRIKYEHE